MQVSINFVRKHPKSHRSVISVHVRPGRFLRFFIKPFDVAFLGHGTHWKKIRGSEKLEHQKPNPKAS